MSLICEFGSPKFEVIEEKKTKKGDNYLRARAIWQRADFINTNKRLYPRNVLEKEIKRLETDIKAGQVLGMSHHPPDALGETKDVSHVWESISIDKDGTCRGTLAVIPTEDGRNIIEMIKAGVKIPLSSRGVGTLTRKEKKVDGKVIEYNEVNDDFKIISPGDFVMSPSVEGAGLTEIMEQGQKQRYVLTESDKSVLKSFDEKEDKETMTLKEFNETVEAFLNANFLTSDHYRPNQFDEFKRNNEARYRKVLAENLQKEGLKLSKEIIEEKKTKKFESKAGLSFRDFDIAGATAEEKEKYQKSLNETQSTERERKLYVEALRAGYRGTFREWQEKYSKVVPIGIRKRQLTEKQKEKTKKERQVQEKIRWNSIAGKSK